MKKVFKPASLLLYLLAIVVFMLLGMSFAGLIDAGQGQGLAAGAIVVGYGVIAAVLGLIASIFIASWSNHSIVVLVNKLLGLILLLFIAFFIYRFTTMPKPGTGDNTPANPPQTKPMSFSPPGEYQNIPQQLSMGFFRPNFFDSPILYFYNSPKWEKSIIDHTPIDSMVFEKMEIGGYSISYAPPWLVPEYIKLDYDVLLFKVLAISQEYCRIEGNKYTKQETYVDRRAGTLQFWPDFLLSVSSIEIIDPTTNPVRIKPLAYSPEVKLEYAFLKPVEIRGDWVQVQLLTNDRSTISKGWVQWKIDDKLLIEYSIFS